ncbi:MAG: hypothetical protein ABIF40_05715 [archaeon]
MTIITFETYAGANSLIKICHEENWQVLSEIDARIKAMEDYGPITNPRERRKDPLSDFGKKLRFRCPVELFAYQRLFSKEYGFISNDHNFYPSINDDIHNLKNLVREIMRATDLAYDRLFQNYFNANIKNLGGPCRPFQGYVQVKPYTILNHTIEPNEPVEPLVNFCEVREWYRKPQLKVWPSSNSKPLKGKKRGLRKREIRSFEEIKDNRETAMMISSLFGK